MSSDIVPIANININKDGTVSKTQRQFKPSKELKPKKDGTPRKQKENPVDKYQYIPCKECSKLFNKEILIKYMNKAHHYKTAKHIAAVNKFSE